MSRMLLLRKLAPPGEPQGVLNWSSGKPLVGGRDDGGLGRRVILVVKI